MYRYKELSHSMQLSLKLMLCQTVYFDLCHEVINLSGKPQLSFLLDTVNSAFWVIATAVLIIVAHLLCKSRVRLHFVLQFQTTAAAKAV
jgi:hypothetical protein